MANTRTGMLSLFYLRLIISNHYIVIAALMAQQLTSEDVSIFLGKAHLVYL